jgi:hypothetical protein
MKHVAGFPMLLGKWNFVNETSNSMGGMGPMSNMAGISETITFNNDGSLNMTVPSKTGFGDYYSCVYISPDMCVLNS